MSIFLPIAATLAALLWAVVGFRARRGFGIAALSERESMDGFCCEDCRQRAVQQHACLSVEDLAFWDEMLIQHGAGDA